MALIKNRTEITHDNIITIEYTIDTLKYIQNPYLDYII